jgi:two-component system sensor histidine kinase/response regulator
MSEVMTPRLLIVDDEAPLLRAICETLDDNGYKTFGFTEGAAAIESMQRSKYDLILADLMMPGMNGIEVLQAVVRIDPTIVGIIMTGDGTVATAVEAMKSGALDYILKPFKLSGVLPVLARALVVRNLRLTNVELEKNVRQHMLELEAKNEELEAFSYSVSHDLRNPLTSILGFSELLIRRHATDLPAEALEMLNDLMTSADRMAQVIEGMLRLARLSHEPLAKERVKVARLVREVLQELQGQPAGRQVEVRVDDLEDATGDPGLVRQVFVNLLSNAIKFAGGKELPSVFVTSQSVGSEKVYSVRDNGVGFDLRQAKRLFGAFQRLKGSEKFAGTGVGLSIVHRIVSRHGGRVWAEAEVDRGATFHFTLPD